MKLKTKFVLRAGFTLAEVLIGIFVVAIILAVSMSTYTSHKASRAEKAEHGKWACGYFKADDNDPESEEHLYEVYLNDAALPLPAKDKWQKAGLFGCKFPALAKNVENLSVQLYGGGAGGNSAQITPWIAANDFRASLSEAQANPTPINIWDLKVNGGALDPLPFISGPETSEVPRTGVYKIDVSLPGTKPKNAKWIQSNGQDFSVAQIYADHNSSKNHSGAGTLCGSAGIFDDYYQCKRGEVCSQFAGYCTSWHEVCSQCITSYNCTGYSTISYKCGCTTTCTSYECEDGDSGSSDSGDSNDPTPSDADHGSNDPTPPYDPPVSEPPGGPTGGPFDISSIFKNINMFFAKLFEQTISPAYAGTCQSCTTSGCSTCTATVCSSWSPVYSTCCSAVCGGYACYSRAQTCDLSGSLASKLDYACHGSGSSTYSTCKARENICNRFYRLADPGSDIPASDSVSGTLELRKGDKLGYDIYTGELYPWAKAGTWASPASGGTGSGYSTVGQYRYVFDFLQKTPPNIREGFTGQKMGTYYSQVISGGYHVNPTQFFNTFGGLSKYYTQITYGPYKNAPGQKGHTYIYYIKRGGVKYYTFMVTGGTPTVIKGIVETTGNPQIGKKGELTTAAGIIQNLVNSQGVNKPSNAKYENEGFFIKISSTGETPAVFKTDISTNMTAFESFDGCSGEYGKMVSATVPASAKTKYKFNVGQGGNIGKSGKDTTFDWLTALGGQAPLNGCIPEEEQNRVMCKTALPDATTTTLSSFYGIGGAGGTVVCPNGEPERDQGVPAFLDTKPKGRWEEAPAKRGTGGMIIVTW